MKNIYLLRNQYSWFADNIEIPDFKTMAGENEVMILNPPNTFKPVRIILEKGSGYFGGYYDGFRFKIFKEIGSKYLYLYIQHKKLIAWKLKDCSNDNNSIQIGILSGRMYNIVCSGKTNVIIGIKSIDTKQYKEVSLSDIDKVWIAGS